MIRFAGPAFEERESIAPGDQLNIGETGVGVRAVGGTPAKERPEAIDLPGERSGREVEADTESDGAEQSRFEDGAREGLPRMSRPRVRVQAPPRSEGEAGR
jgi:hypothetical protein